MHSLPFILTTSQLTLKPVSNETSHLYEKTTKKMNQINSDLHYITLDMDVEKGTLIRSLFHDLIQLPAHTLKISRPVCTTPPPPHTQGAKDHPMSWSHHHCLSRFYAFHLLSHQMNACAPQHRLIQHFWLKPPCWWVSHTLLPCINEKWAR